MGAKYPIHYKCQFCNGSGDRTSKVGDDESTSTCGSCGGDGFVEHAMLIYPATPSHVVFEAMDISEYNGLSAQKQRDLSAVLSAGFVELSDGSNGMAVMEGVFGSESQTIENLKELA